MIVEFALSLTLALPDTPPHVVTVEFTEPVQEVVTYPPEGVLNQISGLPLPDATLQAFEEEFARDNTFFGAFAITKDFGYGFVTGTNSLESAHDIALQECYKHGPVCLIYAEILPQGYAPLEAGQVSLSAEAANYFNNPEPDWGDYRAMAISEDGAYSVVWNYGSPREASDAAMSDCMEFTINDLPELRAMPCMLIPFK